VLGYDQVAAWLKANRGGVLLQAADAAPGGRARLAALAGERPVLEALRAAVRPGPCGARGGGRRRPRDTIGSGIGAARRAASHWIGKLEQHVGKRERPGQEAPLAG